MAYFGKHSCVSVELGAQSEPIILHHVGSHVVFSLSGDQTCSTDCEDQEEEFTAKQRDRARSYIIYILKCFFCFFDVLV